MATKEELCKLLEANVGSYFSGEELAQKLGVSRTAIWKAISSLREEGYIIDAVTHRGYCLSENTDVLSVTGIQKYLDDVCKNMNINIFSSVSSTNVLVKAGANEDFSEGYTVISNEQTKGRGHFERAFYSPLGTGLYMSILLKPQNYSARQATQITTMAAVAVCEAIEALSKEKAYIKWVNDIYINGKKVCGILTEASLGLESGNVQYAVLGIGVNVYKPNGGFPDGLADTAGYVFEKTKYGIKNRLAAEILNRFMKMYTEPQNKNIHIEKYRKYNFVIGKQVSVTSNDGLKNACVLDIDDDCRLQVQYADGTTCALSYGETDIKF